MNTFLLCVLLFWVTLATLRVVKANNGLIKPARNGPYISTASTILARIRKPDIKIIVLLKGPPFGSDHMSVLNAVIGLKLALELRKERQNQYIEVILSGGHTSTYGSEASLTLAQISEDLKSQLVAAGIELTLEEYSLTTRQNMKYCAHYLRSQFRRAEAVIVTNAEWPIGHAQRGNMIGLTRWFGLRRMKIVGIVQSQKIVQGFSRKFFYDILTGVLTALYLSIVLDCIIQRQIKRNGTRIQYSD